MVMADATDSPTKRAILELRKEEGNEVCADCGLKGKKVRVRCVVSCLEAVNRGEVVCTACV